MGVMFRQGFTVGVFPLLSIKVSQVYAFYWNNGVPRPAAQSMHRMGVLFVPVDTLGYNIKLLLGFLSSLPSMFS